MKALHFFSLIISLCLFSEISTGQIPEFSWVKTVGGQGDDIPTALETDLSGNVYLTFGLPSIGDFAPIIDDSQFNSQDGNEFIVKYNPDGEILWVKQESADIKEIAITPNEDIVYVGQFWGESVTFDNTLTLTNYSELYAEIYGDAFIAKRNESGNIEWATRIGSHGTDIASIVKVGNLGSSIYVNGKYSTFITGEADFGNGVTVPIENSESGLTNFLAKYNSNGEAIWVRTIKAEESDKVVDIDIDAHDNLYVLGEFSGRFIHFDENVSIIKDDSDSNLDFFLAKYSPDGFCLWAKFIDNKKYTGSVEDLTLDQDGNLLFYGVYQDSIRFNNSNVIGGFPNGSYFAKYSPDGDFIFVKDLKRATYEVGNILTDNSNNIYLGGSFSNDSISFGNGIGLYPNANIEYYCNSPFIAQFNSNGDAIDIKGTLSSNPCPLLGIIGEGLQLRELAKDRFDNIYWAGYYTNSDFPIIFEPDVTIDGITSPEFSDVFIAKLGGNKDPIEEAPEFAITHYHQLTPAIIGFQPPNKEFQKRKELKHFNEGEDKFFSICADGSESSVFKISLFGSNYEGQDIEIKIKEKGEEGDFLTYGGFINYKVEEGGILEVDYVHPNHVDFTDNKIITYTLEASIIGTDFKAEFPLKIHPAPVLMIHGFWSKGKVFKDLENFLTREIHSHNPVFLLKVDYEDSHDASFKKKYRRR